MPGEKRRAPGKGRNEKPGEPGGKPGKTGKSGKSRRKKPKDSQLVIRINAEERDRFVDLCDRLDTSAAREIRGFIRAFRAQHEDVESS